MSILKERHPALGGRRSERSEEASDSVRLPSANCRVPLTSDEVVAAARTWIGTPYHHQASLKGVGADCLGLIRGVWRDLYGRDAERPPGYSRDWGEASGTETLIEAAARHLMRRDVGQPQPGDVLIFRIRPASIAKHAAILATPATIIHAMEHRLAAEIPFAAWWHRRLAAVYSFPGKQP